MDTAVLHLRIEIGDTHEEQAFTDAELQYFLDMSSNNFTSAKIKIIDRLIADNYKLHRFSMDGVSGDPSSVVNNLLEWRRELAHDLENQLAHSQIVMGR